MANNRLYMQCKYCGEDIYIGKNFGEPYYISDEKLKEINQFFEGHAYCGKPDELAHGGWFGLYDEFHDSDDPLTIEKYRITALVGNILKEK